MPDSQDSSQQQEESADTQNQEENTAQTPENQEDENTQTSEEDEEEPTYHPHKGRILGIKQYTIINSLSFDKGYNSPTGSGKVDLILEKDDKKYVYSGVACKLKVRRSTDRQFSDTGIEEVYKKEEDIQLREHYPTPEMLIENNALLVEKEFGEDALKDIDVDELLISRSASDDGLYGFVTEVAHTQKSSELNLKDWGLCLEDTTKKLEFPEMFRSELISEVIKSYGLVPIVDFTGLDDDLITWTNMKSLGGGSTESDNGGSAEDSTEFNQCSTTLDLSKNAKVESQGDIPSDITDDMIAKIGKADTNYGKWAKGKTPQEVMSQLRSVYKWKSGYSDNAIYKCPEEYFSTSSINVNCADAARLVKCCMDVIGTDCICIHCPGHYYNAIKVDGTWYTCDLTNSRQCKTRTGSNTFGY